MATLGYAQSYKLSTIGDEKPTIKKSTVNYHDLQNSKGFSSVVALGSEVADMKLTKKNRKFVIVIKLQYLAVIIYVIKTIATNILSR